MIILWRCTACGKWSHAARRPKFHQRFTSDEPENEDDIIIHLSASYDHMNGFGDDGGYMVKCGPFEKWTATKEEAA